MTSFSLDTSLIWYPSAYLVIQSHEHDHERSWPTKDGLPMQLHYRAPTAPTYVVSGAGGNRESNADPGGKKECIPDVSRVQEEVDGAAGCQGGLRGPLRATVRLLSSCRIPQTAPKCAYSSDRVARDWPVALRVRACGTSGQC